MDKTLKVILAVIVSIIMMFSALFAIDIIFDQGRDVLDELEEESTDNPTVKKIMNDSRETLDIGEEFSKEAVKRSGSNKTKIK